jgi:hypothetical protein
VVLLTPMEADSMEADPVDSVLFPGALYSEESRG